MNFFNQNDAFTMKRHACIKCVVCGATLMILWATFGCNSVHRRLTITSEPPGATVYLNDKEIGTTPVSKNIVYSGTYKIRCSKEAHQTKTVMHPVRSPWYLWPGVDFFSENFVPGEIRDNQSCHVVLERQRDIPIDELVEEANAMKSEAQTQNSP